MTPAAARAPERLAFEAADGTRLSALVDRGRPSREAVLVLPGFWRRAASPRIRWLAEQLASRHPVYTLDFRGHGESRGAFTFGRLEHLDVHALMTLAKSHGVERVALVGMSMGAACIPSTIGAGDELPVEVAGAVLIAGPAAIGAIRPRPWRGRRDVAWADSVRVPRVEWRVLFSDKREASRHFATVPDIPLRLLHARSDWLVDDGAAERMHLARPERSEFYLLETPGLHADEILGRWPDMALRLVRPFVESALAGAQADGGAGTRLDAAPWREGFEAALRDAGTHSRDLGGRGVGAGGIGDVVAVSAGRDGAHVVARVGSDVVVARGLRDGSVHGVNLLANALAADAVAWAPPLRAELRAVLTSMTGSAAPGPGSRHVVVPRGDGGFEVRPREAS